MRSEAEMMTARSSTTGYWLNTGPLQPNKTINKNGSAWVKQRMQLELPSNPLAVDDSLLLLEREDI